MKNVVGLLDYGFPVFQFSRNRAFLTDEERNFQHLIYHAVSDIYICYRRKYKAVKLTVRLDSVFN
jgi:hypothetical protein